MSSTGVGRIRLAKEIDGILIEVWSEDVDRLRDSLILLETLCSRVPIEKLRLRLEHLWIREPEASRIKQVVGNSVHRVALSLLDSWPDVKRATDIMAETGLSSGFVSNILVGRQGGCGTWFDKCKNEWRLSKVGTTELLKLEIVETSEEGHVGEDETDNRATR